MAEKKSYDIVIIGGGPGGYVCAIRAAQLGFSVGVVEKRDKLGGTCLNVGCIPSKALLHSSHLFAQSKHDFAGHGIKAKVDLDLPTMLKRKEGVVDQLTKGVAYLFKKNKIEHLKGTGAITGKNEVTVNGKTKVGAKHIVIATGSEVAPLPGVEIDEKTIVSSTGALSLPKVPKKMIVVGAGYIGLEMGSVWSRLGSEVTVVEFLDRITPGMDGEVAKTFKRTLEKQGLTFKLGTKVTGAKPGRGGVTLTLEPAKGKGEAETVKADVVLVAIGRRPFTEGLGLDTVGVELNERGFIKVDGGFQTTAKGIYAIGDAIPGPMLAHKAEEEGVVLAELLAGEAAHMNYETVPGIVYTWPEVASVGKTEEQLKEDGVEYRSGKFPFSANSRAICTGDTDGFAKILADAKTDRILGAHIMGPEAGDMIHEVIAHMEYGGSAEDLALSFHGHPTFNEAVREAALAVDKRARQM